MGRIKPMGWTNLLLLLNWVKKNYIYKYIKKNQKLVSSNSLKENNTSD